MNKSHLQIAHDLPDRPHRSSRAFLVIAILRQKKIELWINPNVKSRGRVSICLKVGPQSDFWSATAPLSAPSTRIEKWRRPLFGTAEVCNQKAEVDEGAGEGAETLPTDFFDDLECFSQPSVPMFSMGYDQKHFCHGSGQEAKRSWCRETRY